MPNALTVQTVHLLRPRTEPLTDTFVRAYLRFAASPWILPLYGMAIAEAFQEEMFVRTFAGVRNGRLSA